MRRGFKAEAERIAARARMELGLPPSSPLDSWRYAGHLGVVLLDLSDLDLNQQHRDQLLLVDPESWSGMTLREARVTAIVLNPAHTQARQCSTLMHELSHYVLNHIPSRVDVSSTGLLLLSDFSEEQEAEADWLAAALLLPREALLSLRARHRSSTQIAAMYGVSQALCDWRLRMTGVDRQLSR